VSSDGSAGGARRVLVAGVGNVLLGDDGFGVAVVRRLLSGGDPLPSWARVADFGTRAVHLAYELLEDYDGLILVDAMARGRKPGSVFVFEPAGAELDATGLEAPMLDAHSLHPAAVLRMACGLGARLRWVRVVGCEPADLEEGIGLSEHVERAVEAGAKLVRHLLRVHAEEVAHPAARPSESNVNESNPNEEKPSCG